MIRTDFFHILILSAGLRFLQTSCVTLELESLEIHNFKPLCFYLDSFRGDIESPHKE